MIRISKGELKRRVEKLISLQPVVVLYSLTESGSEIRPVIDALRKWGEKYLNDVVPEIYIASRSFSLINLPSFSTPLFH